MGCTAGGHIVTQAKPHMGCTAPLPLTSTLTHYYFSRWLTSPDGFFLALLGLVLSVIGPPSLGRARAARNGLPVAACKSRPPSCVQRRKLELRALTRTPCAPGGQTSAASRGTVHTGWCCPALDKRHTAPRLMASPLPRPHTRTRGAEVTFKTRQSRLPLRLIRTGHRCQ